MNCAPFQSPRLPRIRFGAGELASLPAEAALLGRRILLVTGARSLRATPHWRRLLDGLTERGLEWESLEVAREPTPELVDAAVARFAHSGIECVVGVGVAVDEVGGPAAGAP